MKRLFRRERAQALVEFGLVGAIFVILLLGFFDIGRAVWNQNTLAKATREGARYAVVHGGRSLDPSGPGSAHFTEPNVDENVTDVVESSAGGINPDRLTVEAEWPDGANLPGSSVKVTSHYEFEPVVSFFGLISITLSSSSTMSISY